MSATAALPVTHGQPPRLRGQHTLAILLGLLVVLTVLAIGIGAVPIGLTRVIAALLHPLGIHLPVPIDAEAVAVVWSIRTPRVLLAILVGASLGSTGAAMQGLFRNPLADPGLLGIQSGAALATVAFIVLGSRLLGHFPPALAPYALPIVSFLGGLTLTVLTMRLGRAAGATVVYMMLLAGVALNALSGAAVGLLVYLADDSQLRSVTFWSLGSVGGATWTLLLPVMPLLLAGPIALPRLGRALDLLSLGEAEARHAGVEVERLKKTIVILVALSVGAAVSVSGVIGFIGLLVPHLLRLVQGPAHRRLLRASAVGGAVVLVGADLVARTAVVPSELPVGVITAFAGAPFLLWLLLRDRTLRGA